MMDVQPGWFSFAWQVVVTICGLGGGIVGMWATLNFAKRKELEKLASDYAEAQAEQDKRLARMEEQLRQAPKHSDLVALANQVGELSREVSRMEGQAERSNNLLAAIHEHLLQQK